MEEGMKTLVSMVEKENMYHCPNDKETTQTSMQYNLQTTEDKFCPNQRSAVDKVVAKDPPKGAWFLIK